MAKLDYLLKVRYSNYSNKTYLISDKQSLLGQYAYLIIDPVSVLNVVSMEIISKLLCGTFCMS